MITPPPLPTVSPVFKLTENNHDGGVYSAGRVRGCAALDSSIGPQCILPSLNVKYMYIFNSPPLFTNYSSIGSLDRMTLVERTNKYYY